jgi:hypothetical protein
MLKEGTFLDQRLIEQLKTLAIYEKRTVNKLIEEAVSDLLTKYTENLIIVNGTE